MESPVVIKTEVEGGVDTATKWVNTEGHCFICLERSAAKKVICLQGLLRHLQINQGDVSMVGGSAEFLAQEWDKITVDLCISCGTRANKLNTLLKDLEKIQMEIQGLLEQTHKSISESSEHPKLLGTFVEKMTKEIGTLLNLGIATNLRKELLNKVSALVQAPNTPTEIPSATPLREEIEVVEPEATTSTYPIQGNSEDIFVPEGESSSHPDTPPNEVESAVLPVSNNAPTPSCTTSIPTEFPERRKSTQKKNPSEVGNSKEGSCDKNEAELESETRVSEEEPEVPEIGGQKSTSKSKYYEKKSGMYHCRQCDKKSNGPSVLRKHYQVVHLKRRFRCGICNEVEYVWPAGLEYHKKTCRQNLELKQAKEKDPSFEFVCEVCGKRFDSGGRLVSHRKSTHESVNHYHCEFCDKKFSSSSTFKLHKNVFHLGKLPSCKFCKKKFKSTSQRWQHQRDCPNRTTNNK